jgi:TatD DNase family protein
LARIPIENLFLETDDTNKSISALYIRGAEIRITTVEKPGKSIEENFNRLLRFV